MTCDDVFSIPSSTKFIQHYEESKDLVDIVMEDFEFDKDWPFYSSICDSELEEFELDEYLLYVLDYIERVVEEKEEEIHLVKFEDLDREEESLCFSIIFPTHVEKYVGIYEEPSYDRDKDEETLHTSHFLSLPASWGSYIIK